MKCNAPKKHIDRLNTWYKAPSRNSWRLLPEYEKEAIIKELEEQMNKALDKEVAEVQDIWIKLACILLHEIYGFGEERLLRFIAAWDRIYRRNARIETKSEQKEWLDMEMSKCFPKTGFPQFRIDRLKEKGNEGN